MVLECDLLLPAPSWVSYDPQARLLGRQVHWLPCQAANGWKLTADTLQQHCARQAGRPQLLVLNSPNNPSGACFKAEELEALATVARQHNVIVLSDEIYSELHFRGEHISMSRFYPEGTIVSNGISKWAGAGGWRLGFMVFPKELRAVLEAMIVVASETFTSVSAPIQMAAITAFEESKDILDYIHACRKIIRGTGEHFSQRLRDHGVEVVPPAGGFYNLPDFSAFKESLLRQGIGDAGELARKLLEETGVATLPGNDFGMQQGYLLRMAYVDFDGNNLLNRALRDETMEIDASTPELQRIFSAADRIGDWLNSL
jgi:aspartate aminotransferase